MLYFVPLTNRQQVTIRIKESTHREKEKRGARTSIAFALKAPSAAQRRSCFNIYGISPLLIDEYIDSHMPETPRRQSSIWLNRLNFPLQTSGSTHSDPVLVHQRELPAVPEGFTPVFTDGWVKSLHRLSGCFYLHSSSHPKQLVPLGRISWR